MTKNAVKVQWHLTSHVSIYVDVICGRERYGYDPGSSFPKQSSRAVKGDFIAIPHNIVLTP
jgi:hypothetical protein